MRPLILTLLLCLHSTIYASDFPLIIEAQLKGELDSFRTSVKDVMHQMSSEEILEYGDQFFPYDASFARTMHLLGSQSYGDNLAFDFELIFDYAAVGDCSNALERFNRLVLRDAEKTQTASPIASYCSFKLGKLEDGVRFWRLANFSSRHTSIEKLLHGVFARPNSLRKHNDLMAQLRKGDKTVVEQLVENAIKWELDWWNPRVNIEALQQTTAYLSETQKQELECVVGIEKASDKASFEGALGNCKLINGLNSLPKSSAIAMYLCQEGLEFDALTYAGLHSKFAAELWRRAKSRDLNALRLLAALQAATNDTSGLAKSDALGRKQFRQVQFALSEMFGAEPSKFPALVKQARRDFPRDPRFMLIELRGAKIVGQAALLAIIVADFENLNSVYESSSRSARALDGYIAKMEKLLAQSSTSKQ
jgi:hypothetical protein